MGSTRNAALWYAEQGWPIFPIWPTVEGLCRCGNAYCKDIGKHPVDSLTPHWNEDATTDLDKINMWWDQCPYWNIATLKHLRIDVDTRNNALDKWRELVWQHGLDEYVMAKTPSGGQHWYFETITNRGHTNRAGDLPSGIDVRGDGSGYTLLPPSNHIKGIYQWGNHHPKEYAIPKAPAWLLAMLPKDDEETIKVVFNESVAMPNINSLELPALAKAILQRDKSRIDQAILSSLVRAGCTDDEIFAIWQKRPPTCKMRDKGGDGNRYLALSLSNARKYLTNHTVKSNGQNVMAELMK